MDYQKIIVALITHFIASEGTDYLGEKGQAENQFSFSELSPDERAELGRLRDIARTKTGWHGY